MNHAMLAARLKPTAGQMWLPGCSYREITGQIEIPVESEPTLLIRTRRSRPSWVLPSVAVGVVLCVLFGLIVANIVVLVREQAAVAANRSSHSMSQPAAVVADKQPAVARVTVDAAQSLTRRIAVRLTR